MRRHRWVAVVGLAGLAVWFAALLLPAPPFGEPAFGPAQRLLRRLALVSSEGGFAMIPDAPAWLDAANGEGGQ